MVRQRTSTSRMTVSKLLVTCWWQCMVDRHSLHSQHFALIYSLLVGAPNIWEVYPRRRMHSGNTCSDACMPRLSRKGLICNIHPYHQLLHLVGLWTRIFNLYPWQNHPFLNSHRLSQVVSASQANAPRTVPAKKRNCRVVLHVNVRGRKTSVIEHKTLQMWLIRISRVTRKRKTNCLGLTNVFK